MALALNVIRLADGPSTAGHNTGIVARLVVEAGFDRPETVQRVRTAGGTLEVLAAHAGVA